MELCETCHLGRFQAERVPYIYTHQGQMQLIPDVPALVCDYCHYTIHDPHFMESLVQLLNSPVPHPTLPDPPAPPRRTPSFTQPTQ
jgi:YgiT-type zinc finger domain-containing protein